MTTLAHTPVDDPDQLALIADNWTSLGQDDYEVFIAACRAEADAHAGWVNPNRVRARLMVNGELSIDPRRYSALWSTACSKDGPMVVRRDVLVQITGQGSKGNGNKAVPMRLWRSPHSAAAAPFAAGGGIREDSPPPAASALPPPGRGGP